MLFLPCVQKENLWIAYPKPTSKIVSDLNRDCNWECLHSTGFTKIDEVVIDHVWTALRFCTESANAACDELDISLLNIDATVKDVMINIIPQGFCRFFHINFCMLA